MVSSLPAAEVTTEKSVEFHGQASIVVRGVRRPTATRHITQETQEMCSVLCIFSICAYCIYLQYII